MELQPESQVWADREKEALPVIADALARLGWELN